jgi:UDP-N-acetylglucosamine transferase subunit ALG13
MDFFRHWDDFFLLLCHAGMGAMLSTDRLNIYFFCILFEKNRIKSCLVF